MQLKYKTVQESRTQPAVTAMHGTRSPPAAEGTQTALFPLPALPKRKPCGFKQTPVTILSHKISVLNYSSSLQDDCADCAFAS